MKAIPLVILPILYFEDTRAHTHVYRHKLTLFNGLKWTKKSDVSLVK